MLYLRGHVLLWPLATYARLRGVYVVQECNGPHDDMFLAWPWIAMFRSLLVTAMDDQYRRASVVVCVTPLLADWVRARSGAACVAIIPNGANTEIFSPARSAGSECDKPYAIFFGALAPWQGIEVLLAARKDESWPAGLSLRIAGDGSLRGVVEQAAREGGIEYLGKVPYEDLGELVAGALMSIVPMPASERTMTGLAPLKLFESLAAGLPVVVSDVGGMAEVIRTANAGLVVEGGNPHAIAAAVRVLWEDAGLRSRLGASARRAAVESYSWDVRAQQTSDVLLSLFRRQAPQRTS